QNTLVRSEALNRNRTGNNTGAQAEPSLSRSSVSTSSPKKSKPTSQPEPAQLESFTRFYKAYPRHEGKKSALAAWIRINPGAELTETIIQALAVYAEYVKNEERRFVKLPTTWLNGAHWEDELGNSEPVKEYRFVND